MASQTDAEAMRAWLEGHRLADEYRRREVAAMSYEEKLRSIADLMAASSLFDMARRARDDKDVRERWARLRRFASATK